MKTDSDPDPVEPPRLCHEVDGVRYALRCKIDPEAGPDDLLVRCLSALGLACTRASDLRAWGSYWRARPVESERKRAEVLLEVDRLRLRIGELDGIALDVIRERDALARFAGQWIPGRSLVGDVAISLIVASTVLIQRNDLDLAALSLCLWLIPAVAWYGLKTTFSGPWSPGRLFRGALERVLRLRRNP